MGPALSIVVGVVIGAAVLAGIAGIGLLLLLASGMKH
jgi:hypothetical protein